METTMVLATLLAATIILQSSIISTATTAHVVGGSTGWTIPPNTTFYSDWASSQTITSGDTLVFNFPTGAHTVVEVPKSSYDACSTTKQIGSTINNGPATVTITSGTHYYICGVPGHCSAGQKLAITVAAAVVATAPSTPPAASKLAPTALPTPVSPAPTATTSHVVGGSTGWTIPPNTTFYSDWASSQTITSGATLVFNFPTGAHTVVEVPKSSYDACSTTKQIGSTINNGPATVTITSGTHYYICGVPGHCSAGQKLAITVAATAVATPPSTPPTTSKLAPAALPTPVSPAPAATTAHVVGGSTGWTIPPNTTFYSDWASRQTITSGDTLVFNFPTGAHTVVEVPKSSYDACSTTKQIGSTINNGPATVTITSGTHYYICGVPGHCSAGQKLAITVAVAVATPPSTPPTTSKLAPAALPTPVSPAPAVAPTARTVRGISPTAAPKMSGPTSSNPVATPVPVVAPSFVSPPPTVTPVSGPTTASSPAPTATKKPVTSPPASSIPTVPGSTAIPPTAPGPSGSGNASSSSPTLRSATGIPMALLFVVVAFWLV